MEPNITFKEQMYAYATEYHKYMPSSLNVVIPEVFLTGTNISPTSVKVRNNQTNIFENTKAPAISGTCTKYNYMTIKVANSLSGTVHRGDKFIVQFINCYPDEGMIVERG